MNKVEELIRKQERKCLFFRPSRYRPTFIPIWLNGGTGDVIMNIDLLRRLSQCFKIVAYTDHAEALRFFCHNEFAIEKGIPLTDWFLEIGIIAKFQFTPFFHGFLIKEHEQLFTGQLEAFEFDQRLAGFVRTYSKRFALMAAHAEQNGIDRRGFPLRCLGLSDKLEFQIQKVTTQEENYITIHDGYDPNIHPPVTGRATKTWKWEYWNALVRWVRRHYPELEIIQLGGSTARPIDGTKCLINKTTMTQALEIIAKSKLHVDGDSGLVHAATRMGVKCVVIWGPTPVNFYGYPQNTNIRSSICPTPCYHATKTWNSKCVLGHNAPKCMDETKPSEVFEAIEKILGRGTALKLVRHELSVVPNAKLSVVPGDPEKT